MGTPVQKRQRAIFIYHDSGNAYVMDSSKARSTEKTPYDLNGAFQRGARIVSGPHPINTNVMLIVEENEPVKS